MHTVSVLGHCMGAHTTNVDSKTVRGWNEYVDNYFQISFFWHNMWIQNGKPRNGVISDIRH